MFLEMFGDLKISEGESTLEDCLKIQQGFAFKSEEFTDSGTPIIKIGTVNKGFSTIQHCRLLLRTTQREFGDSKLSPVIY